MSLAFSCFRRYAKLVIRAKSSAILGHFHDASHLGKTVHFHLSMWSSFWGQLYLRNINKLDMQQKRPGR